MGLLANSILAREAFFAYIVCDLRLVEIYVPFADVTSAPNTATRSQLGVSDEWHLDLEKNVTMDNLGSCPACPHSSKKRDLRAIRVADRSRLHSLVFALRSMCPPRLTP